MEVMEQIKRNEKITKMDKIGKKMEKNGQNLDKIERLVSFDNF